MEVLIMDEKFQQVCLIDAFESLIWTERYHGFGDFEIYTPANAELMKTVKQDYYAWLKDSDQVMIVEEVQIGTEVETGGHLTISGRSLESILDRRIVWQQTVLNGNLQNGIKKLITENVISPVIADRKIAGFVFQESKDPYITGLTIRAQYTGDNLYETIETICKAYNLGFQIILNEQNQFVFSLYSGADRSYDQSVNPYVVFSPKFENIINSNYLESKKTLKNVTLVAGEDAGSTRRTRIVGTGKDLNRREIYTDARDIQSETQDGKLSDGEYNAQLGQRGKEKLSEYQLTKSFEGQVESTQTFVYGKDFYKGDIVQIVNEYGIESKVRVIEIVRAQDTTGYETYPTFSVVE